MYRQLGLTSILAVMILLSINACIGQLAIGPITTKEQAEQQARKVLQIYNWPDNGRVHVTAPPEDSSLRRINIWRIDIGKYTVALEASNGQIRILAHKDKLMGRVDAVINIDAQIANVKARSFLTMAGFMLDDVRIESSAIENHTTVPGCTQWAVRMRRYYQGYPFMDDGILIYLDPLDGDLLNLGYACDSPLPNSTTINYNQQQAMSQAANYFQTILGKNLGNLKTAELQIVTPDNYFEIFNNHQNPAPYQQQSITRLAWVMEFDAPMKGVKVWIDAENGTILGGAYYR